MPRASRAISRSLWPVLAALPLVSPGCGDPAVGVDELQIRVTRDRIGQGRGATVGDVVCIDYEVLTADGRQIQRARDFCFELGAGVVIAGLDDAIRGMRLGGERTVVCPPHKHWGRDGYGRRGQIPKSADLTLEIRLRSLE